MRTDISVKSGIINQKDNNIGISYFLEVIYLLIGMVVNKDHKILNSEASLQVGNVQLSNLKSSHIKLLC